MKTEPIERLSNELIRLILDQVEPYPDKTVPIDRRQFLSVESFDRPPPPERGSVKDIGRFRCACKRFADIGAPLLYARVATRFSKQGLEKLEQLASWPHLARHVKKFTYLLPYFYKNGGQEVRLALPGAGEPYFGLNVHNLLRKAEEQQQIIKHEDDVRVLKQAIASFTSLQFVQLLRVADEDDTALLAYIRQHAESRQFVSLEWEPACSHGSRTIGAALLYSNVPALRFSSPMLSPQSARFLAINKPRSLPTLAARLTCLTLHFDDGNDLDQKMRDLSTLFRTVFTTAQGMQAVHVGFPSHRPLNLPLEDVFHNVKWDKLVAFGVQGWKLEADEIIQLALRHRERLKGLRLRDVLLKEGSMWKNVLSELRECMYRLEWVSLRRIGYARHFDDLWLAAGAEVPDDPPPGESDSETDDDENNTLPGPSSFHPAANGTYHIPNGHEETENNDNNDGHSEVETDSDDEHSPDAHEMDFPSLDSPETPASAPWCICSGGDNLDTAEELGDDGYSVSNTKRKAWEKWVVRRCP